MEITQNKFLLNLKIALLTPLWLLWFSPKKKSWAEFKSGCIKHKCEYDYDNPKMDAYGIYYKCKHLGCNYITNSKNT